LIAVTVTTINGSTVGRMLQTDGSGALSQQAAYVAGTSLSQGFKVHGTVKLTFTGSYPPLGGRLKFTVMAGNVACATAGQPTTEIAYIQSDHLNTPRTVTDAQQRVIWNWDYQDPFGANAPSQDPDGDGKPYTLNLRFPGQYFDAETGLHYNYFRDYDPSTGRYLQSDPIGLVGGMNLYGNVGGMPIRFVDPYGLDVGEPGFGESFIPIWGSGRQAINDFQTGHYIWGSVNSAVALSDVALVGYGVKALCKGAWKLGSHTWGATRKWYGKTRELAPNTPVHHWAIPQGGWGGQVPDIIKNQPWNLNPMPDWATHANIHGYGPDPYNAVGRWWYGTPDWAKIGEGSLAGKAANSLRDDACNCAQ
jgi:RHS repeat-associated protein